MKSPIDHVARLIGLSKNRKVTAAKRRAPQEGSAAPHIQIAYNDHGLFAVPMDTLARPVTRTLLGGEIWERETIELILAHAGTGDVIHAGAFFGDFLPALSRGIADGARVWAFEPVEQNFRCAEATRVLNGLDNVVLTHAGLSRETTGGQIVTHRDGEQLGGASFIPPKPPRETDLVAEIALVAIDDILPSDRSVSVIHLDIEHHERAALLGAARTLERCRPLLILETVPGPKFVQRRLAPLGYRVAGTVRGNTVLSARDGDGPGPHR